MAEEVATKAFPFQQMISHPMEEAVRANRMVEVHQTLRSNRKANGVPKREKSLLLRKRDQQPVRINESE